MKGNYLGNFNEFGIHTNNDQILRHKVEVSHFSPYTECISYFTSDDSFIQDKYYEKGVLLEHITEGVLCLIFPDHRRIEFSKISDLLDYYQIDGELKKIPLLSHDDRMGECHYYSLLLFDICSGYLVTGYVNSRKENKRIIHSWIETKKGNVLDISNNLSISISDYYEMMNPQVVNVIAKEDFLKDWICLEEISSKILISSKIYCLFRNELLMDLNRNHLLNVEESNKKLDKSMK